jgi:hypothetical protein
LEAKEIARRLLEIDRKLDTFEDRLLEIGINIDSSVLSEIDMLSLVMDLFGITSEEDREAFVCEYMSMDGTPELVEQFIDCLSAGGGSEWVRVPE